MLDNSTNDYLNTSVFRENLEAYQELQNQTAELPNSRASGDGLGSGLVGGGLGLVALLGGAFLAMRDGDDKGGGGTVILGGGGRGRN
jgi:hypothetical protein